MKKYLPIVLLFLSSLGSLLAMDYSAAQDRLKERLSAYGQQQQEVGQRMVKSTEGWQQKERQKIQNTPKPGMYTNDYQQVKPTYSHDYASTPPQKKLGARIPIATEKETQKTAKIRERSPSPTGRNNGPKQRKGTWRDFVSKNKK